MPTPWNPSGRSVVSTFVIVRDAMKAVAFAQQAFGAELAEEPLMRSDGRLWNAELRLGGSTVMVAEATSEDMLRPAFLYVMVEDVDAAFARAVAHGATPLQPVEDQFYGDRAGGVADPCGNWWWIATHQRAVPPEELVRLARLLEAQREGRSAPSD